MQISPVPYIPRPRGVKPDLRRPLRREPVRRDEVRVYRRFDGDGKPQWLVTMPPGTYRLEEHGKYGIISPGIAAPAHAAPASIAASRSR